MAGFFVASGVPPWVFADTVWRRINRLGRQEPCRGGQGRRMYRNLYLQWTRPACAGEKVTPRWDPCTAHKGRIGCKTSGVIDSGRISAPLSPVWRPALPAASAQHQE